MASTSATAEHHAGSAAGVVERPVDRVEQPAARRPRRDRRALLAEHAVARPLGAQQLEQRGLGAPVGLGDDVGRPAPLTSAAPPRSSSAIAPATRTSRSASARSDSSVIRRVRRHERDVVALRERLERVARDLVAVERGEHVLAQLHPDRRRRRRRASPRARVAAGRLSGPKPRTCT